MSDLLTLRREQLSPPGDDIQEAIDSLSMSQKELAERMGKPKEKINDLIKGREPITMKTAIRLERVLGTPKSYWLNREQEYREQLADIELQEFFEECVEWAKNFPLSSMKKLGWIPEIKDKNEVCNALLQFFGVATPERWNYIYVQQREISVAFRASLAHVASPEALSVWLRKGQLDAQKLKLPPFNKAGFKSALEEARNLACLQPNDFSIQLQEICHKSGVALVYTPKLAKAPISGATRWIGSNPIIQLSDRYKTNDRFWFTFFHEAGHILKHGKKEVFLDGLDTSNTDIYKEKEADQFAADCLIPRGMYEQMLIEVRTTSDLEQFADNIKMHPGIIIGRLQHEGVIHYSQFNEYKERIELFDSNFQNVDTGTEALQ